MLKDLMHALFKEEIEEEVVEEPVQAVQPAPVVETAAPKQPVYQEPVYVQPEPAPVVEEAAPVHSASIFEGLEIEEISRKPARRKNTAYKFDRNKLNKNRQTDEEYQAVLSPIFGNVEDDKKEFDKVHDAIKLPVVEEDFSMTQVISPMFGNDLPTPQPRESLPKYEKKSVAVKDLLDQKDKAEH
jgi:hypothetical protein